MTSQVPDLWPPSGQEVVFLLLGVVALGSALLVVTTRQIVHAALWLVVCFGALAGGYLVLTAEFVAWVQVLIYVGAIVVLLLFGIMLTRAPIGRSADLDSGNRVAAATVAVATAAVLVTVVVQGFAAAYTPLEPGGGAAATLGASIFRSWVLPFEALSVLLLAALIGAIVLSRTDIRPASPATDASGAPSRAVGPANPGPSSRAAGSADPGASSDAAGPGAGGPAAPKTPPHPPDPGPSSTGGSGATSGETGSGRVSQDGG
ncbi:NADH-quinone oxidoreductase subunit J [Microtetraspora fusca]|uniref:NADH-quinone oxidoreductase subunit J n=1 Tax=Microtetraspora fusca TaxID=1997 RepID=A0ABW6V8P9_MICFU